MPDDGITFERIRERAYDIWDRNHRPDGFDVEFWLLAERELKAEAARQAPPNETQEYSGPEAS